VQETHSSRHGPKEGSISSKTLAETKFSADELAKNKEAREKFLNSLDPLTRRAIINAGKELRAKRKAEGKK
jgi:hypothetical protein